MCKYDECLKTRMLQQKTELCWNFIHWQEQNRWKSATYLRDECLQTMMPDNERIHVEDMALCAQTYWIAFETNCLMNSMELKGKRDFHFAPSIICTLILFALLWSRNYKDIQMNLPFLFSFCHVECSACSIWCDLFKSFKIANVRRWIDRIKTIS